MAHPRSNAVYWQRFRFVVGKRGEIVFDDRTDEQNRLIVSYDERGGGFQASALGVMFEEPREATAGTLLLPTYNLEHRTWGDLSEVLHELAGCKILAEDQNIPNFLWLPFALRGYYKAHQPLEHEFEWQHMCRLVDVLSRSWLH